jgi:NTE family protein
MTQTPISSKADLVLEGGGVKGIALVGALSVLEERGYEFNRVAGTSAGAIVGALVAAGFPAGELRTIMNDVDYRKFRDGHVWEQLLIGKAVELLLTDGVYRGEYLRSWLGDLLKKRGVDTFADLPYQGTGHSLPSNEVGRLVVMASDISQGSLRRFPWDYSEHYGLDPLTERVADAVRMSMSIPFFYQPVHLKPAASAVCSIVDGGMLSNFPVDVFDAPQGVEPRWPTFGIKLSVRADAAQQAARPIAGVFSMAVAMLNTLTGFYDRMHIDNPDVLARTIFIDTGTVKATDFDIDKATQQMLYDNGRAAASRFLDGDETHPGWNFDSYINTFRSTTATPTPNSA